MKKYCIVTVDTEGDSQWDSNARISTENVQYLPRFQKLCEEYRLIPVWLTNYEMAMDESFVTYFRGKQDAGLCEIGMHLHAWNNPPEYSLARVTDQRDYLYEYPYEIMDKKIGVQTQLLTRKFGMKPVSHRSGRWAMDDAYFKLLEKHGYKCDCSVTPGIDWSCLKGATGKGGANYVNSPIEPYMVANILEVPMTIRTLHCFQIKRVSSMYTFLREIKDYYKGKKQWLRPDRYLSDKGMLRIVDINQKENVDYIMFMIHSSELMPGGNPSFTTTDCVENLYYCMEEVFSNIHNAGYHGISLRDYCEAKMNGHLNKG